MPAIVGFQETAQRVVNRLKDKGFVFLFGDQHQESLKAGLQKFDEQTNTVVKYATKFVMPFMGAPPVLKEVYKYFAGLHIDRSATPEQLDELQALMAEFDLNAVKFTVLFGPKYLACVDCDDLTAEQITAKARAFEKAAAGVTLLAGKT